MTEPEARKGVCLPSPLAPESSWSVPRRRGWLCLVPQQAAAIWALEGGAGPGRGLLDRRPCCGCGRAWALVDDLELVWAAPRSDQQRPVSTYRATCRAERSLMHRLYGPEAAGIPRLPYPGGSRERHSWPQGGGPGTGAGGLAVGQGGPLRLDRRGRLCPGDPEEGLPRRFLNACFSPLLFGNGHPI